VWHKNIKILSASEWANCLNFTHLVGPVVKLFNWDRSCYLFTSSNAISRCTWLSLMSIKLAGRSFGYPFVNCAAFHSLYELCAARWPLVLIVAWSATVVLGSMCRPTHFRPGTDLISLLILFLLLLFWLGRPLQKSPRHRRFKSHQDEVWTEYSSSKYASINGVGFSIWRHTFKMTTMTSFHALKSCHLASEYEASACAYAAASVGSWSIVHSIVVLRTLCDFYFG